MSAYIFLALLGLVIANPVEVKIIGIKNGYLGIQCKLTAALRYNKSLLSWQKNGHPVPDKYIRFEENYAYLNIPNATVKNVGFYYLALNNEVLSCRRHVKLNVTKVNENIVFCSCIDLQIMNCSFRDTLYHFEEWVLWFKHKEKNNCIRNNDGLITCQAVDNGYFINNVSEWRIVGYNATSMAELTFHFDSRKYITFEAAPYVAVKNFANHSSLLIFEMDRFRLSYYNNLYGSSEIIYKILIKDQWGSNQEILTKDRQVLFYHRCPNTNYTATVTYQKDQTPLPEIWSSPWTVKFKNDAKGTPPVSLDKDAHLQFLSKLKRCFKTPDFDYVLQCSEKNRPFTKKNDLIIKSFLNRECKHYYNILISLQVLAETISL